MASFFAILQAALSSFPHTMVTLISCTIFAASCSATSTPLIISPLMSYTMSTPTAIVTRTKPVQPTAPRPARSAVTHTVAATPTEHSSSYTSVMNANASSGITSVQTTINGVTTTDTIPSGSGVQSVYISNTVNGETITYASTTPITEATAQQMAQDTQARAAALESRIKAMMRE